MLCLKAAFGYLLPFAGVVSPAGRVPNLHKEFPCFCGSRVLLYVAKGLAFVTPEQNLFSYWLVPLSGEEGIKVCVVEFLRAHNKECRFSSGPIMVLLVEVVVATNLVLRPRLSVRM